QRIKRRTSESTNNPNPNKKGKMSSVNFPTDEQIRRAQELKQADDLQRQANELLKQQQQYSVVEPSQSTSTPYYQEESEPENYVDEDEELPDYKKWLHSNYKNYLTYALPLLPFFCREPFINFWNSIVRIKRDGLKIKIDLLKLDHGIIKPNYR
ncbi:712_t:CDS:1, partial [Gigaspora margarita]